MFPLVPIDSQTGDFDVFGNPLHGVYEFDYFASIGVRNSIPGVVERSKVVTNLEDNPTVLRDAETHWMNTSDARQFITGVGFTRDPALEDFDETNFNEWRDVAIINTRSAIGNIYSRQNFSPGWLYLAPDGSIWGINVLLGGGSFNVFEPNNLVINAAVTRYGVIKFDNSFWNILDEPDEEFTTTIYRATGATGISDFDSVFGNTVFTLDIKDDGSEAMFALGRQNTDITPTFNFISIGDADNFRKSASLLTQDPPAINVIYKVALTGTPGVDFAITPTVFKDQAACGGAVKTNKEDIDGITYFSGTYSVACVTDTSKKLFQRPNLITLCIPPAFSSTPVVTNETAVILGSQPDTGNNALLCGINKLDKFGNTMVFDIFADNFLWWQITAPADQPLGDDWEESPFYPIGSQLQHNGFVFESTLAHDASELFQPGVSAAWQDRWDVRGWDAVAHAIGDIPRWTEATSYSTFDAVHDGAANYFIAKGRHVSFDSTADPAEEDFSQPGVGSSFENFWDGPFSVALNDFWFTDRLYNEDWVIANPYTETALADDNFLQDATWRCIRTHVSSPDREPGVGANWFNFWERTNQEASGQNIWEPPVIYGFGDRVLDDDVSYDAISNHVSTAATRPPSAQWIEFTGNVDCTEFSPLLAGLGNQGYQINQHFAANEDIDYEIEDTIIWAHYRESGSVKLYQLDVQYTRTKRDTVFNFEWPDGGENGTMTHDDGVDTGVVAGLLERGRSSVIENLTWRFKVDGSEKHEITLGVTSEAKGLDEWTETFSNYPDTWLPFTTKTTEITWDGDLYGSIDETFNVDNTNFGGPATKEPVLNTKAAWSQNDFVSGVGFAQIDNPIMEATKNKFRSRMEEEFPGPGLIEFPGGNVLLGPISFPITPQFLTRPQRTQEQKDEGDPLPSITFVTYGQKLVGPVVFGGKQHDSLGGDFFYRNVLEPNDFPWRQYGVFAPDVEQAGIVNLTVRQPLNDVTSFLQNGVYGDDISCAHDPVTKAITRNSQFKVVYI